MIQRQENNRNGGFLHGGKNWYGKDPPTVEQLKAQIRNGNFTFVSKLRYFTQSMRGTDGYWRGKGDELRSWIDYHVANGNGPPTHFMTLTCAENWWPGLRDIFVDIAMNANRIEEAEMLRNGDRKAMARAARENTMYVNKYFMMRAKRFLDEYARDVLELEHYWGRVEFAPGRGAIHLHILGIAKNKAYLHKFYNARTEKAKAKAIEEYATTMLGMTADVEVDERHDRFRMEGKEAGTIKSSPLGTRFTDAENYDEDHVHLAQDCVLHKCHQYCLGEPDPSGIKLRTCKFGFGTEETSNEGNTPGKELRFAPTIQKNEKGVEHLLLRRTHSRQISQHSRYMLQAWRANVDVQLIIYRSNPDIPDVSEIEAVCRYCTSYASKAHQTTREEINMIQDVITA